MAAGRRLLEEARARAAAAREWQVVRLVQDSLDYAQGRITRYDVEERYRLFQDGARDEHDRDFAGAMTHTVHQWLVDAGRGHLVGHPGAGAEEFLAHFARPEAGRPVHGGTKDRPGRYRIPRGRAERALWLERILRDGRIDAGIPPRRPAGSSPPRRYRLS
ncbi:hypothetical protein [Streptomyces sp. P10-4]|uniref:hypothetical protein n=1 Tax=Streptomyces sp. P10-4 TaxID=3421645 RepID=UPI003D2BCB10